MVPTIRDAIQNRSVLRVEYPPGERLVEPHCLGISGEGDYLLRAFQTGGASASGEHINWKLFRIDRMQAANDTGDSFSCPRPEYNPNDKAMKGGIIACL